eukprot:g9962.t1
MVTSEGLKEAVQVFKEPIAFTLPSGVPKARGVHEVVEERVDEMSGLIVNEEDEQAVTSGCPGIRLESQHGKKPEKLPPPPGELGSERLMELLAASFDWDPALRDPGAALAYLGRKVEEKVNYEDMVRLLLDARFRTRDEGRSFVLLSLAEAETLRRVLHARLQARFDVNQSGLLEPMELCRALRELGFAFDAEEPRQRRARRAGHAGRRSSRRSEPPLRPKDTFALGVVDLIPESWGSKAGKNFLLFDARAGLAVQRIQLAPNGNSDRRINKYSLTLWFRTPMLPSKADRMLLLDLPRGEMESEEESATNGSSSVFVWRGGVVAPEGSWSEIGWPGSQNQVKRKAKKDLQSRGEVLVARGLPALDALRIARALKEYSTAGAEFVEDKSQANELKVGDMVQLASTGAFGGVSGLNSGIQISPHMGGGGLFGASPPSVPFGAFDFGLFGGSSLEPGEAGKVTNVNFNRGQVHVEGKKGGRWYTEDEVMKVDPKALGLVPLTDSEWAGLPSTRSNYVTFSQQLPNPLLEGGWMGKGRAEKAEESSGAEVDLNFDVVQMGFMSSYVDAKVFYAEAGLEIRGHWRAADGSVGSVVGTKALAGLALGGLWHLELQTGAESMQHAWNCWFSSFPPSSGSNTSTIQISGAALAGPLLQEGSAPENAPPPLLISGEMTGKGGVSFTMSASPEDLPKLEALGAKNWIGSTWEGDLGTDRWLRGAWRVGSERSGRWRARHIGRQAVNQTLKPMVDAGAEWEPKRCEIRSATVEAKTGVLKKGMKEKALVPAFALQDDSRLFTPLGDEFEGVSFTRFPITQGSAYAEVRVLRTGRTMPILGFGVLEEKDGKTILVRMAIIEGRTARKLETGQPDEAPAGWDHAKPYGDRWQEGDVICCQVMMPSGTIAFGLNGDFQAPMGTAFDLQLPPLRPNSRLCLVASAGENGRLRVNVGQVAFSFPPPTQLEPLLPEIEDDEDEKEPKEGESQAGASPSKDMCDELDLSKLKPITVSASMGLGEQMNIRPLWQVKLPKAVKAWPVYALPSRDSQGRRAMKDGEVVEQVGLEASGSWVQHQAGWSPCRMVVVGHEYEALKPTPAWVGIDKKPKEKVRKAIKRVVHASFDTELCSQHCWNFRGSEEAQCSNGPNMLVSMESAASGVLRWCIKSEAGNKAMEVGVVPADKAEEGNYLFEQCDCGVKSTGTKGGSDKKAFDVYLKYIEVIADLDARTMKVMVGDNRDQMVEVKSADIPFEEDIKLDAWTNLPSQPPRLRTRMSNHEQKVLCWNNTKLRLEPPTRDKLGDSDESEEEEEDEDGLVVTSCGNAVQASTKGVWICRCTARNAADARVCWRCRSTRTRSGVRPPGDADPRVEGLTIVTADSFRELVLDSQKHVLLVASASWCPPCQQLKPLVHRLAQLLSHGPMIAIGVIDTDENDPPVQWDVEGAPERLDRGAPEELQSRYFPEPHIPNVKFFLQGKKRQPISVQGASGMSLDELAGFIEQHTGISIQSAIEKSFPAYAERVGVYELLKKLRACAMTKQVQRSPGQAPLKSLASFLYNELITGCQRAISAKAPTAAGAPPALMRAVSGGGSGARTRAQIGYSPTLAMGVSDPRLTERLLDELEKKLLSTARVAQPEDGPRFLTSFLLRASCPSYNHANFYNAMSRVSWQVAPQAVKLLAATRIFRFVLRWAQQRRLRAGAPPLAAPWAPPPPAAEMSAAAQRHSWRRIEIALSNEDYRHGLAELGLLLDRGLPPDTAPFGLTPLLLAAAIGHLPAAQFLYVRGASPHVPGGQPPILPVEAAARHNHLRIVELLIENGSCSSRALHFAAAGGSTDVANYLLSKSCSPDATVQGLSPVAACLLLSHCDEAALGAPLSDEGCSHCGLAPGSTVAHLAAAVGGLCEAFFQGLLKTLPPSTVMAPNHRGQTALDLMPTTLRIAIKPQIYSALAAAAAEQSSHHEAVALALERKADPLVSDSRGFSLLNLAAYSGEEALVDVMLSADAKQVQSLRCQAQPEATVD